jgi:hypothetical protein
MAMRRLTYDMISIAVMGIGGALIMGAAILWLTSPAGGSWGP